jgi:hypothetical protein
MRAQRFGEFTLAVSPLMRDGRRTRERVGSAVVESDSAAHHFREREHRAQQSRRLVGSGDADGNAAGAAHLSGRPGDPVWVGEFEVRVAPDPFFEGDA